MYEVRSTRCGVSRFELIRIEADLSEFEEVGVLSVTKASLIAGNCRLPSPRHSVRFLNINASAPRLGDTRSGSSEFPPKSLLQRSVLVGLVMQTYTKTLPLRDEFGYAAIAARAKTAI